MRLAVTGRTGQVVTALCEAAAGRDDLTVVPLGRPQFDLAHPGNLQAALRELAADVVVNAAAYTAVDQAESEFEVALAVNGAGARAVAEAAAALALPIIQISTDYVFDGSKTTPYVETDPVAPVNAYGRSKLAGEKAVAAAQPDHAILRTAWVYAAEGKNFLRTMLRLAATRPELAVVADQHGAPTYAPDIAAAVIAVARNLVARRADAGLRGVFHMSGGGETTWAGFAGEIFRLSAARGGPSAAVRPITTAEYPTPARRPMNSRLDCSKLARVHGVVMPEWRDALARCMDRLASTKQDQVT
ncbi:MAG: dTDP-4-dehydrorhamnose reductase [Variibacter sp.]|nr:dTDP-4-dehydrorhamnose reductase [Variibacter sp.]